MAKGNRGGKLNAGNSSTVSELQAQVDRLKQENLRLFQQEPSGHGYWGKQTDSNLKKISRNEQRIKKLEKQIQKLQQKKATPKGKTEKKANPLWRRAGEGWYIGENGHEIRENYDAGGFDIVKVSGRSEKIVKHFAKLSDARKYKVR